MNRGLSHRLETHAVTYSLRRLIAASPMRRPGLTRRPLGVYANAADIGLSDHASAERVAEVVEAKRAETGASQCRLVAAAEG